MVGFNPGYILELLEEVHHNVPLPQPDPDQLNENFWERVQTSVFLKKLPG